MLFNGYCIKILDLSGIYKSRNGESGNGMRGIRGMGVGMQGIGVGMRGIWMEM